MKSGLRTFSLLLGGGLVGRAGRWLRRFNFFAIVLSTLLIATLAMTGLDRAVYYRFEGTHRAVAGSIESGWFKLSYHSDAQATDFEKYGHSKYTVSRGEVEMVEVSRDYTRERITSHLTLRPVYFGSDRRTCWYSLAHGVFHLWSLPLICVAWAVLRGRKKGRAQIA